jgi:hypothetical protein
MLTKSIAFIGLITALSIFSGCQGTVPAQKGTRLDRNWGRSYESAKRNQILNPEAGRNLKPVVGLDGEVAEKNMQKYKESDTEQKTIKK